MSVLCKLGPRDYEREYAKLLERQRRLPASQQCKVGPRLAELGVRSYWALSSQFLLFQPTPPVVREFVEALGPLCSGERDMHHGARCEVLESWPTISSCP